MEIWKPFQADRELYEISNYGNVRKAARIGTRGNIVKQKNIKPYLNSTGYYRIKINVDGKQKDLFIHRLVALLFIENPLNKLCVNHKDGNKLNNNVTNLEWCSSSENNKHAFQVGLKRPTIVAGETHGGRIFDWKTVCEIRTAYIKGSREYGQCALARKYNTSQSHIWSIVHNKNWKNK